MDARRTTVILGLAIAGSLLVSPLGAAATTFEGSISAGHPGTLIMDSAAERFAACDPGHRWDGFDGKWFDLRAADGSEAKLERDPALRGIELYFYDAECDPLSGVVSIDVGCCLYADVPSEGAFVQVSALAGNGPFTLTIGENLD